MSSFLSHRQPELIEQMDKADCDLDKLNRTYQQFHLINRLLSQWKRVYTGLILPRMTDPDKVYTLLDIGFGGGDIPISFAKWAAQDGFKLEITAIETDPRALEFVNNLTIPKNIEFKSMHSSELIEQGDRFNFVISNHVLHHLDTEQLPQLLQDAERLASDFIVFNDIERNAIGYLLFNLFSRLFFWNSFITEDGLISIRKSFTKSELQTLNLKGWEVKRLFPFRLLLTKII